MPSTDDELKKDQPKADAKVETKAKSDSSAEAAKPGAKPEPKDSKPEPKKSDEAEVLLPVKKSDSKPDDVAETASKPRRLGAAMLGTMKAPKDLKSTVIKVSIVVVALLAIVVAVFGVLIYGYKSESSVVKAVSQIVPYPVERVNGQFVSYSDYLFEVDANKRAYQNNAKLNNQPAVNFTSAEGKKLVVQIKQHSLDKLKSDAVTEQLAKQKKVKITDKQANELVNQLYQRYGGKDTLLKTLKQIYGWDLADLKVVVRKQLLAQELQNKVTSDPAVDAAAKAKAQDVLKKIKEGGDFAALAKQYSQASDAASGGDLGFFTKGQLPDELFKAAQALQPGQVSDAIKDQYGYEILKIAEKKDDGSIHASHILIKTLDFNEYFEAQLKKAKVNIYVKA